MPVEFKCDLVAVIPVSFQGDEGEVSYKEYYLVNTNDDGTLQMLKFNSQQDFKVEGIQDSRPVKIIVRIDPTGKQKPKLTSLVPLK